jgi:hypothetical protein
MSKGIIKFNNKRTGSAMVFVILLFLITIIIITGVNFLFSSNLRMSVAQEENMRAYYLALSGIDVTKATLLSTLYVDSGVEKTMFQKIRESNIALLEDNIDIEGKIVDIKVTYDKGDDVITIDSTAPLGSGSTKTLSLQLEFSGNQFKEYWVMR